MGKTEAEKIRSLYRLPAMKELKCELAKRVREQRKILKDVTDHDALMKAQGRLEAYEDILKLGKKSRNFFNRLRK